MPRKFTAEELIAKVRDEARIPNTGSTGSEDQDILNRINEFLLAELYPAVMETQENYFVRTPATTLVASTSRYRIPARAMYQKARDIRLVDSDGNVVRVLTHIPDGDIDERYGSADASNSPSGFYLEGNEVVLWPPIGGSPDEILHIPFYFSPGELVLSTAVRIIESVDSTTSVTLTAEAPTAWTITDTFDAHSPNSGAEVKVWDRSVSVVSGTTITFSSVIDGSVQGDIALAAGDYICLAGEAGLPGIPKELHPAAALGAACVILEDDGDIESSKPKRDRLNLMLYGRRDQRSRGALGNMEHRVEVKPRFIRGGRFLDAHGRIR